MRHDHPIFPPKDFKKDVLENVIKSVENLEEKVKKIRNWQKSILTKKINSAKEEELQADFLYLFFGEILGYAHQQHLPNVQLRLEVKTQKDQTKVDGALGYFEFDEQTQEINNDVRVVIELKEAYINLDKKQYRKDFSGSPVEQAFNYASKFEGKTDWVIVSDFVEIRLYHYSNSDKYELFKITELLEENNLAKFFFLLQKDRLFLKDQDSPTKTLFEHRRAEEIKITNEFYKGYRDGREMLFYNLCRNNPSENALLLLTATQKMMDRLVFMCFVRDAIPMFNVLGEAKEIALKRKVHQFDKIWYEIKCLFKSFNIGYKHDIPAFNGGLFQIDDLLERLRVPDEIILPFVEFILKYDFQSELNVSILGHIFEQSISDLEILRSEIGNLPQNNENFTEDQLLNLHEKISKRKKDGIFYTPEYVTKYMLQQSIGEWLEEKKQTLLQTHQSENADFWNDYEKILQNISILDPACGSGAFLTAVFDFLWAEWKVLLHATVQLGLRKELYNKEEWQTKKQIVLQNIYGVDVNMESVEITKLALWLQTASVYEPLSDLSQNIKRGNSLINDPEITKWAFDWKKQFPTIKNGFDVVIGNPPYVRADLEDAQYQKERKWITEHYEFLYEKWDLMTAFYEKALKFLLKEGGAFAFISSNAINTSKYAEKLQKWMCENFDIKSIDYFENIEVFEGVGVIPTIISIKKAPPKARIKKNYHKNEFGNITSEIMDLTNVINKQAKIFRQQYEDISQKTETVLLSDICYISKGMVVNADEHTAKNEFVKSDIISAKKTKIFNTPYIEGKDLKHYLLERIRFLEWGTERVPAKLSRVTFPSLYTGEKIMRGRVTGGIYENTGLVCNDSIILFKKFIDLQNVKSRSISVSISKNHFEKFGSKTSEEIAQKRKELEDISTKFELKYLLAIINSKYAYWFLNNFRRSSIKNYFYPDDFRNLPIPLISEQEQQIFVEKVDLMMSKGRELQTLQSDWFVLLPQKLKPKKKLTKKLANWFLGDFEFFVAEMQKVGIAIDKLDYKERQKLKTDFSFAQADALPLHDLLEKTDQQIDDLVYKLYNLSSEEINLVEKIDH